MYEEEKIFGPFTFKQGAYLSVGVLLAYTLWKLSTEYALFAVIVFVIFLALTLYNSPRMVAPADMLAYLQRKRSDLGESTYQRWLRYKIANIDSQIAMRKERGLPPDNNLEEVLGIFKQEAGIV